MMLADARFGQERYARQQNGDLFDHLVGTSDH
jgi:hypothetical protein